MTLQTELNMPLSTPGYKARQEYLTRMAFLSSQEAVALKIQVGTLKMGMGVG